MAGVGYCLLTGRALCVDWRDGMYSDDFSNSFSRWFEIRGVPTVSTLAVETLCRATPAAVYPPFWTQWLDSGIAVEQLFDNDHMAPANVARTSLDFTRLDYPHPVLVGWAWDTGPALRLAPLLRQRFSRFARDTDAEIVRRLLTEHIYPLPDLQAEVTSFADTRFSPERTVGIHIRHTDLQSPLERMLHTLQSIAGPQDTVFLATDNAHVEMLVRRLYPHVVFCPKIYPPHDEPLHSHVPGLSSGQKGHEALLDMLLLARCHHIIHYAPSSFARIPILLSGLPQAHIHSVTT